MTVLDDRIRLNYCALKSDDGTVVVSVNASVWDGVDGQRFEGSGSAKLAPGDRFREETGVQLALGRALKKLGSRVERAGHKYTHSVDETKLADSVASKKVLGKKPVMVPVGTRENAVSQFRKGNLYRVERGSDMFDRVVDSSEFAVSASKNRIIRGEESYLASMSDFALDLYFYAK